MIQSKGTEVVDVSRRNGASQVLLVCEHASYHIPAELGELGLSDDARFSHVAWDPGALGVARAMSVELDAVLVASTVSRLVYDFNRPPDAADAMPARSEAHDIPGNADLTAQQRRVRAQKYYEPFCAALEAELARKQAPVIVTVHSFTPVYNGSLRDVEIGFLHDSDQRLADALLDLADRFDIRRNDPYGPQDGVTHTLKRHGVAGGHLNVMLEVRNDLIKDDADQIAMGKTLASWLTKALAKVGNSACKT